jgi:hypothetical protein
MRNPAVNSANRAQQRRDRVGLFKELDRQDRSQAPENVKVIPLDDVSDRRRNNHAAEILGDLNCHCFLLFELKGQAALGRAMFPPLSKPYANFHCGEAQSLQRLATAAGCPRFIVNARANTRYAT